MTEAITSKTLPSCDNIVVIDDDDDDDKEEILIPRGSASRRENC